MAPLTWHVRKKFLLRKSESVVQDLLGRSAGHLRHAFDPSTRFFRNGQLHHSPQVSALKLSRLLIRRVSDLLRLFRFRCGTAHDHLVEQLPDQSERVDLVVMLPSRKAQQFSAKGRIPRRAFRHVQSVERHAAADRLRTARFVAPSRKLLAIHVGFALALARFQKGSDARSDLPLLFSRSTLKISIREQCSRRRSLTTVICQSSTRNARCAREHRIAEYLLLLT